MELISKDYIIDEYNDGNGTISELMNIILDAPIVDARPVLHAKWIRTEIGVNTYFRCSHCDFNSDVDNYRYCPYCGARMDCGK